MTRETSGGVRGEGWPVICSVICHSDRPKGTGTQGRGDPLQTTGIDSVADSISVPALERGSYGRRRALAVLLFAWCALLFAALAFGLGGYPLLEPDEGRNAEV